jgi:hypothetical protein
MKDRLPEEAHIFAAAIPDMRAHFESAAARSPDYRFVLASIAEDLAQAEADIFATGTDSRRVAMSRFNLIAAAEGSDYYPLIAHEFESALEICLAHQRRMKGPSV